MVRKQVTRAKRGKFDYWTRKTERIGLDARETESGCRRGGGGKKVGSCLFRPFDSSGTNSSNKPSQDLSFLSLLESYSCIRKLSVVD